MVATRPASLPTLELDVMKTFVAIAETGNFTTAAEAVFRTPSAVSMQIKKLEETLQVPLFVLFVLGVVALRREESRLTRARLDEYAATGWFTPEEVRMLATGPGRRAGLAWAARLPGDRRARMRTFIREATALAAARQRLVSGRDPKAAVEERTLLTRVVAARQALFAG